MLNRSQFLNFSHRNAMMNTIIHLLCLQVIFCAPHAMGNGCPRGSFSEPHTSQCTLCRPGFYQPYWNASSCIPCEAGEYLSFSGAQHLDACRSCSPGTFSSAGSSSCLPCPRGTNSAERSSECISCPLGTVIGDNGDGIREHLCVPCSGGYGDEENLLECKECPPGSAAPRGASSADQCVPCPAGTSSWGGVFCNECQHGLFSAAGSSECTSCPLGSEPETDFGATKCKLCEPGQYGKLGGWYTIYASCFECPEHTTSYGFGARFCRRINGPCPSGYIETSVGDCERCETDEMYDMEEERCVPCPRDEGSVGGLPLHCAPCEDVIRARVKDSHCFPPIRTEAFPSEDGTCPPGSRIYEWDLGRFCRLCDPGYFSSQPNSHECVLCPTGTVSKDEGATGCESCPEGMTSSEFPNKCVVQETNCPLGTYLFSDSHGSGSCVPEECSLIEDGSYSCPPCRPHSGGPLWEGCDPCPGQQVRDRDYVCGCKGPFALNRGMMNGTCSECPIGSYGNPTSEGGENECIKCPVGTYRDVATLEELKSSACYRCSRRKPCKKCQPGFVARREGATECQKCPPETFTYGIGDTECLQFGAPSGEVTFNDPLDLNVKMARDSIPDWW